MLLDDVMSELDAERRLRLAELLRGGGQALITATERRARAGRRRAGGRDDPRRAGGALASRRGMRRRAPRAARRACSRERRRRAPRPTRLLARVQAAWPEAAGAAIAAESAPGLGARRDHHGGVLGAGLGPGTDAARDPIWWPV